LKYDADFILLYRDTDIIYRDLGLD